MMAERPAPRFAVEIITLVPALWPVMLGPTTGLVGRAFEAGPADLRVRDLRRYGKGPHRQVDDSPFGGGAGMVLGVEPLHRAIVDARAQTVGPVILLSPRGRRFTQGEAQELAAGPGMTLVCGRYEGVDERVKGYVDRELSLGDFVLSAGDPAAFSVVDAVVRLLPGVLGNPASLQDESFGTAALEYPQYTRPAAYDGVEVPEILRSGDHARIAAWRREQALALTRAVRPDLLAPEAPETAQKGKR
jgi:tRNA (guanine37-N1)-methyltransferase